MSLFIKNAGEEIIAADADAVTCQRHGEISRVEQLVNWKVMYL